MIGGSFGLAPPSTSWAVGSTFALSTDLSYFVPLLSTLGWKAKKGQASIMTTVIKKHKERKNSEIVITEVKLDLLSWVKGRET